MTTKLITILLVLVGLINFLPVMGLFSVERMQSLYGVDISDPNLAILMRHRALLFGLVGGFILYAAFTPAMQPAAFVLALISMAGFWVIAATTGEYNTGITKVVRIDIVGLVLCLAALLLYFLRPADGT